MTIMDSHPAHPAHPADKSQVLGGASGCTETPAGSRDVDEALERLTERHYQAVLPAILVVLLALFEWFRWWYPSPGEPLIFTLFALVAIGYAGWHLLAFRRARRSLLAARKKEWQMGQALERLRDQA